MPSRNRSVRQVNFEPSESSSWSQMEDTPSETDESLYRSETLSAISEESEESSLNDEIFAITPEQQNIWAPLDNFKASFVNQAGRRFHQLLERGTLKLDAGAIIWMDENGLPTTGGLPPLSHEELERPIPFYYAGRDADVSSLDNEAGAGRAIWRQPPSEEENSDEILNPRSSLFEIILAELRLIPRITHYAWKKLLSQFETLSASGKPHPDSVTTELVLQAIEDERGDLFSLENLENTFYSMEVMMRTNLADTHDSIYSLAGIDFKSSTREADLEMLHEDLGTNVSEVMRLANMLQSERIPRDRRDKGQEIFDRVANVLRAGKTKQVMMSVLQEAREKTA
ncbi:hypothetical protein V8C35DRAFT_299644 [Trichoderma chlorosporum]